MTEPLDTKALYESLDAVQSAVTLTHYVNRDELAEIVAGLTGLVWQDGTHERDGAWVFNPDMATESRKMAFRWLRDHGYLPRP